MNTIERFTIGFLISILICQIGSSLMYYSDTIQRFLQ